MHPLVPPSPPPIGAPRPPRHRQHHVLRARRNLENCKNTEFATILEMGLREAYAGRGVAVFAYEALKDTHTEHPAALGSNRGLGVR
jgi:hypothetical protein